MSSPKATAYLRGISASPGLARGPLVRLEEGVRPGPRAPASGPDDPARLRSAIALACAELTALIQRASDPDAAALLAFQVAMLQDLVVPEPAFTAMAARVPPEQAWLDAMELQIRQYDTADDLYIRARASDLLDMRDRVSRALSGATITPVPAGSIVLAADLPPSRFLEISWEGGGIALTGGSANSHVAMLARARGVPMLIGLDPGILQVHGEALLDADNGMVITSPDAQTTADFAARQQTLRSGRLVAESHMAGPAG